MKIPVVREADARVVLDRFRGFHDALLSEIRVAFANRPTPDGAGEELFPTYLVEIVWLLPDYGSGTWRKIAARFDDAGNLALDLRGLGAESWTLRAVTIRPLFTRPGPLLSGPIGAGAGGEAGIDQNQNGKVQAGKRGCLTHCARFALGFILPVPEKGGWTERAFQVFDFATAEFEESSWMSGE